MMVDWQGKQPNERGEIESRAAAPLSTLARRRSKKQRELITTRTTRGHDGLKTADAVVLCRRRTRDKRTVTVVVVVWNRGNNRSIQSGRRLELVSSKPLLVGRAGEPEHSLRTF